MAPWEEPKQGERVSNARPSIESLNNLAPYYTMYPLAFPMGLLDERRNQSGWVLDPFCGRGTTNYAARLMGRPTIGVDSNPVATAITAAKLVSVSPAWIHRTCVEILETAPYGIEIPLGRFWELAFHQETLIDLCRLRASLLDRCDTPSRIALRALLLGSLHGPRNKGKPSYLSNQMPRSYAPKPRYVVKFWREKGLRPHKVDVADLVERRSLRFFSTMPPVVESQLICADSRHFDFRQIGRKNSTVVTSPPYLGLRSYGADNWLRNWFLGGPPEVNYQPTPDEMIHDSADNFSLQLSKVWAGVADACIDGATMVIRFGGVRQRRVDPREILRDSIDLAQAGWKFVTARSAGLASHGKRQAQQFRDAPAPPVEETDYYLRLG